MTLNIWTEFVCETCAKSGGGEFVKVGSRIKSSDATTRLREAGWIFSTTYTWCSHKCMQDMSAEDRRTTVAILAAHGAAPTKPGGAGG